MESVAKAWFRRVWNEGDAAAIDELFAVDGEAYGIYGQVIKGPPEFRHFHEAFRAMFGDIHIDVVEEIADGDKVAIKCEARMVHKATNQRVPLAGTAFLELRNGQIYRAWNHWDFLNLLEAMQLLPVRSFELAVTGQLEPHPQCRADEAAHS